MDKNRVRRYYAGCAMQSMIKVSNNSGETGFVSIWDPNYNDEQLAKRSFEIAEALIKYEETYLSSLNE